MGDRSRSSSISTLCCGELHSSRQRDASSDLRLKLFVEGDARLGIAGLPDNLADDLRAWKDQPLWLARSVQTSRPTSHVLGVAVPSRFPRRYACRAVLTVSIHLRCGHPSMRQVQSLPREDRHHHPAVTPDPVQRHGSLRRSRPSQIEPQVDLLWEGTNSAVTETGSLRSLKPSADAAKTIRKLKLGTGEVRPRQTAKRSTAANRRRRDIF